MGQNHTFVAKPLTISQCVLLYKNTEMRIGFGSRDWPWLGADAGPALCLQLCSSPGLRLWPQDLPQPEWQVWAIWSLGLHRGFPVLPPGSYSAQRGWALITVLCGHQAPALPKSHLCLTGSPAPLTLILVYLLCAVSAPTAPSNLFHYIPDMQHGLL